MFYTRENITHQYCQMSLHRSASLSQLLFENYCSVVSINIIVAGKVAVGLQPHSKRPTIINTPLRDLVIP